VWLPLILLLLDMAVEKGQRRLSYPHLLLAGLVLGIGYLAGHPQSAMYVVYTSLLYLAWRGWRRGWCRLAAAAVIFLAVGAGLAAVQLIPSFEYMRLSTRAQASYEQLANGFPLRDVLQVMG